MLNYEKIEKTTFKFVVVKIEKDKTIIFLFIVIATQFKNKFVVENDDDYKENLSFVNQLISKEKIKIVANQN